MVTTVRARPDIDIEGFGTTQLKSTDLVTEYKLATRRLEPCLAVIACIRTAAARRNFNPSAGGPILGCCGHAAKVIDFITVDAVSTPFGA